MRTKTIADCGRCIAALALPAAALAAGRTEPRPRPDQRPARPQGESRRRRPPRARPFVAQAASRAPRPRPTDGALAAR